jgi:hypothetical protein
MEELIIMLAASMPVEELAKKIKEAAEKVIENPKNIGATKELSMFCSMLLSKEIAIAKGGPEEVIKRFKNFRDQKNNSDDEN